MPFISVRDIEIYYEIHGTGPPLLSISGTGGDLRRSPNIFEMPIARHFRILAYDQRGLGPPYLSGSRLSSFQSAPACSALRPLMANSNMKSASSSTDTPFLG